MRQSATPDTQPRLGASAKAKSNLAGQTGLGLFALTLFLFWLRLKT